MANALQIPMHRWDVSSAVPFEDWGAGGVCWPEPMDNPLESGTLKQFREIAAHTGVLLSGKGCDNLMVCKPQDQLRRLWRRGKRAQAAVEAAKHAIARFGAPDGLRGPLRRIFKPASASATKPSFPEWLNPELAERLDLKTRWSNPFPRIRWDEHPRHPKGYASLFYPHWRRMFETQDPAYTRASVEVRYPFLDVRIVNFLLAIPALPWFFRKFLLREAMRGRLPETTRRRPKTPGKEVLAAMFRRPQAFLLSKPTIASSLAGYVKTATILSLPQQRYADARGLNLLPWCLNFWLEGLRANEAVDGQMVFAKSNAACEDRLFRA